MSTPSSRKLSEPAGLPPAGPHSVMVMTMLVIVLVAVVMVRMIVGIVVIMGVVVMRMIMAMMIVTAVRAVHMHVFGTCCAPGVTAGDRLRHQPVFL